MITATKTIETFYIKNGRKDPVIVTASVYSDGVVIASAEDVTAATLLKGVETKYSGKRWHVNGSGRDWAIVEGH